MKIILQGNNGQLFITLQNLWNVCQKIILIHLLQLLALGKNVYILKFHHKSIFSLTDKSGEPTMKLSWSKLVKDLRLRNFLKTFYWSVLSIKRSRVLQKKQVFIALFVTKLYHLKFYKNVLFHFLSILNVEVLTSWCLYLFFKYQDRTFYEIVSILVYWSKYIRDAPRPSMEPAKILH